MSRHDAWRGRARRYPVEGRRPLRWYVREAITIAALVLFVAFMAHVAGAGGLIVERPS